MIDLILICYNIHKNLSGNNDNECRTFWLLFLAVWNRRFEVELTLLKIRYESQFAHFEYNLEQCVKHKTNVVRWNNFVSYGAETTCNIM